MSSITSAGSSSFPTVTVAPIVTTEARAVTLSPLERATALAGTSGKPLLKNEQLAIPYIPSATVGSDYSYDTSTGTYSWKAADTYGDVASVFDQIGILTPVSSGFTS